MKENKKLTELTLEELHTKRDKLKGFTIGISIVMLILCVGIIYFAVVGENYAFIVVAICCLITLFPMFVELNQIDTEIKYRNL